MDAAGAIDVHRRVTPGGRARGVVDARDPPGPATVVAGVQAQPAHGAVAHDIDHAAIGIRRRADELVAEYAAGLFRECRSAVARRVVALRAHDDERALR